MRILFSFYLLVVSCLGIAEARRKLKATSLVACMRGSKLVANSFDVEFNPDDRTLSYDLDIKTEITGNARAEVEVWAYGFKVIERQLDMCKLSWKQFCPLVPATVEIKSSYRVESEYADQIPGLAYQVPDIDTHMRVYVKMTETGERVACLQASFTNGKTVSQLGVKWVTAVVAVCGLLASAILSAYGNSNAASHISANTVSLFLYFQSVVVVNMEHVHFVPPIAAAWSENFIWSMGLIRVEFMQKIFRWYVQSTGGHPSLFLTSKHMSVLTQRALSYVSDIPVVGNILHKRANVLYGNERTVIFRGIRRLAFRVGIENTAVVCTGLTFFVLFAFLLAGLIVGFKYFTELSIRAGWIQGSRFHDFRMNWVTILKGVLLRYIYLGFTQLTILCLWELFQRDSAAVIILAILFFLLSTAIMVWAAYRSIFFAKISLKEHRNPAAILYGDSNVLNKYGFLYTMYDAPYYWWSCILLGYILLKSLFISLVQASGKVQALCIFLLDLVYLVMLNKHKPYLDRSTNILNITISSVTVTNSFLFIFFSDLFGQPGSVSSIMGAIFFVLNAAFSLVLLIMILVYVGLVIFSKNPDLRFKPARDDRASFQRRSMIGDINEPAAKELLALASAAKAHNENWQTELQDRYAQQLLSASEDMSPEPDEEKSIEIPDETAKSKILSVTNILKRKLSLKRNPSTKSVNTTLSRHSKF